MTTSSCAAVDSGDLWEGSYDAVGRLPWPGLWGASWCPFTPENHGRVSCGCRFSTAVGGTLLFVGGWCSLKTVLWKCSSMGEQASALSPLLP